MYCCTHRIVEVVLANFNEGEVGERVLVEDKPCDLRAATLAGLIAVLRSLLGLDIRELDRDPEQSKDWLNWTCVQTEHGRVLTAGQRLRWERGEKNFYVARYAFLVEHRETRNITLAEFQESGILHGAVLTELTRQLPTAASATDTVVFAQSGRLRRLQPLVKETHDGPIDERNLERC